MTNSNIPIAQFTDPPMSRAKVLRITLIGFAFIVGLVFLAASLGYRRSDRIQDIAQTLVREHLIQSERGAQLEALIVTQTQELIDNLAWVLGLCLILAISTAGLSLWIIHRAFLRLESQAVELEHVSWHMIDGHEKMARRFAHEMHDELGQSLSGLRRILGRIAPPERQECVAIVDEVLESVRKLAQALRPVILDDFGLDSGLRWLCERFTQRTQVEVDYTSTLSQRLATSEETHLFRIAQEALTNIARHSQATRASVSLEVIGQSVVLEIKDNGHGLPLTINQTTPSLGMVGMRARARQLGGELIVENRKEGGLCIRVNVPLQQVDPNADSEDTRFTG
ncbi:MAG: sensor histidine kinase [Acidobacteria bacterium]|nr:sensor histidine kinase [Acidobacteriota bacterium]